MNVSRLVWGLLLAGSASASVVAAPVCAPVIEKAWVRAAPPGATTLAGYLVLRNPCAAAVRLVGVESRDFRMPMIHRSAVVDGVSRMRPAGDILLPPGGTLHFAPGGLHLMLMKPIRALREGDQAGIRLVLADGRRVFAPFPVRRQAP